MECTTHRLVRRGERAGIWEVDGERYAAATICGQATLLPLGRPVRLTIDEKDLGPELKITSISLKRWL